MPEPSPDDATRFTPPADSPTYTFNRSPDATPPAADATGLYTPPNSAPSDVSVGTALGDYELLAEIARGGMGVVYKARQGKLNRVVALKVNRAGQMASAAEVQRFQVEAEAAAKLDHPHIVPVYEVGEASGHQFIAMAFVEGRSLGERVRAGPLPPREAAQLLRHVADAVAYAHSRGVVHRDLKPGNILMDASGQPRVTDFGLAKSADADSSLTQAGQVMGTPNFMPPEQAEGKNDEVGPLADVYSLGATLYCLLTGRPPFQAASVIETLKQVVEREPAAPHHLNPAVDRDLDTVCLKCLQKRPDRRYLSAAALAEDLQRYLDRRPILARPVGVVEKAVRWARRNPLPAASVAVVVTAFLVAFTLVSGSYVQAERAREDEATQRQAAERKEKAERWERYRANMIAAGGAMQLHNVTAARNALDAAPEEHRNWEWRYLHNQLDTARHVTRLGDRIQAMAVSPDGTVAAVQPADGPARLWNLVTDREMAVLPNRSPVPDVGFAFSPDGKTVAYKVADQNHIVLWDIPAGRESAVLSGPERAVTMIAFSPNGRRIVAGSLDGIARIWDTATGRLLHELRGHGERVETVAFSPDGRKLVSTGLRDHTARVWDADTGKELAVLPDESGEVQNATFSPQGDRVLTSEQYPSSVLRLWDATTGRLLKVLRGHTNSPGEFAFSPDGTRIATAGLDQTVRLWDGRTGEPVSSRDGHRGYVTSLAFNPDGKSLVTSSRDQTARVWDAATGAPLGVLHGHTGAIRQVQYSPDGQTILTLSPADGTVRRWDARSAERNGSLRGHTDFVYSVAFHPDGGRVASSGWDGTVRVWDATNGRPAPPLPYPFSRPLNYKVVSGVAFHPNGELLAACGRDGGIQFWDLSTSREAFRFQLPPDNHYGSDARIAFSPRGDRVAASGGMSNTAHVWDVGRRAEVAVLRGHKGYVTDLCFSPDGAWLASASSDQTVRVWDLSHPDSPRVLEGHTDFVRCLAVSRDGTRLASGGLDGTVRVWDTTTWQEVADLKHGTNVYGVAFTPDGSRLAAACANNMIRFWDTATSQLVVELEGHTEYVHQLAFSPDGTRLVSASGDKTVRVWDTLSVAERVAK